MIALVAAAGAVALTPAVSVASGSGTAVCDALPSGTTTWTHSGSPYTICNDGVSVPADASLVVDGSSGPVVVDGTVAGGITVSGGDLETANTSATDIATFQAGSGQRSWPGIRANTGGTTDLRFATLSEPGDTGEVLLTDAAHVHLSDDTIHGDVSSESPDVDIERVSDTAATCTNPGTVSAGDPTISLQPTDAGSPATLVVTASTIDGGCDGLSVGSPNEPINANDQITVQGVAVDDAAGVAMIVAGGTYTLGSNGTISGNTGSDDSVAGIELAGTETGGFAWIPVSTGRSSNPLGYWANGVEVEGPGIVTVPKNSQMMVSHLNLSDSGLDAGAGGIDVYSPLDISQMTSAPAIWAGWTSGATDSGDSVDLSGATVADDVNVTDLTGGTTTRLVLDDTTVSDPVTAQDASIAIDHSSTGTVAATDSGDQTASVTNSSTGAIQVALEGNDVGTATLTSNTISVPQREFSIPPSVPSGIDLDAESGGSFHVTDNEVIGPGRATPDPPHAAIYILGGNPFTVGPGGDVSGNTTANDAGDLSLKGTLASNTTWITPVTSLAQHPMGYVSGGIKVPAGVTLTLPAGGTISNPSGVSGQIGTISVSGSFVADPGSTLRNVSLSIGSDGADHSELTDINVDDVIVGYATTSTTPRLVLDGVYGQDFELYDVGGPVSINDLNVTNPGNTRLAVAADGGAPVVALTNASGSTLTDSSLSGGNTAGISVSGPGADASISGTRITGMAQDGVTVDDAAPTTLSCDVITDNQGGVTGYGNVSVSQSSLDGNAHAADGATSATYDAYDPDGTDEGTLSATDNWWGQPLTVLPGQTNGDVDTSDPTATPPACDSSVPEPLPPPVESLTATDSDGAIALSWDAVTDDSSLDHYEVRMATGAVAPSTPTSGTEIYSGTSTTATATDLTGGEYSFAVFTVDGDGAAEQATVSAIPDNPAPLTYLYGAVSDRTATLSWVSPAESSATVVVRVAVGDSAPASPTAGAAVYRGAGTSTTMTNLAASTDYSFAAFVIDSEGNTSSSVSTTLRGNDLAISRSTGAISYGDHATITGVLTASQTGAVYDAGSVQLEAYQAGTWAVLTTGDIGSSGTVQFSVSPTATTQYRLAFDSINNNIGCVSSTTTVEVLPVVTASVTRHRTAAGEKLTFTGRARPALAGARVYLQRRTSGVWRNLTHVAATQTGRFSLRTKLARRHIAHYRVLVPASKEHKSVHSRTVTVTAR